MKKFMVLFMASPADFEKAMKNFTPEQQKKGMDGWMQWMIANKTSIVDHGGPLGKTRRVDGSGVSDTKNGIGGYSIVQAASPDDAAKLFGKDHPHLQMMPGALDRTRRDHAGPGNVKPAVPSGTGAAGRYAYGNSSSRACSLSSVFGLVLIRCQSFIRQALASPEQVRARRHSLCLQCRNDPIRSHCARIAKSRRLLCGSARHCSCVKRPMASLESLVSEMGGNALETETKVKIFVALTETTTKCFSNAGIVPGAYIDRNLGRQREDHALFRRTSAT